MSRFGAPLDHPGDRLGLDGGIDLEDRPLALERRGQRLGEAVHADDGEVAGLEPPHALGVAGHEPALELVDRLEGAAEREHVLELGPGALGQLVGEALHDDGALEEVGVLEQVGLVGEHLLHPQRPLLVPRAAAGRAPRSTPAAGSSGRGRRGTA